MLVYKHTSKTTGKSYIGVTKNTIESRWNQHKYNDSDFGRAIREYGTDDFIHEILEDGIKDSELMFEREKYWIKYYNTYLDGYNMNEGGSCWTLDSLYKGHLTRSKIQSDGLTIYQKCSKKAAETMYKLDSNGVSIHEKRIQKGVETKLKTKCMAGSKNGNSKIIQIFDNFGKMVYETHGNFIEVCNKNNLPLAFADSYRNNGKPLYMNVKSNKDRLIKDSKYQYKGWYAKVKDNNEN